MLFTLQSSCNLDKIGFILCNSNIIQSVLTVLNALSSGTTAQVMLQENSYLLYEQMIQAWFKLINVNLLFWTLLAGFPVMEVFRNYLILVYVVCLAGTLSLPLWIRNVWLACKKLNVPLEKAGTNDQSLAWELLKSEMKISGKCLSSPDTMLHLYVSCKILWQTLGNN